MTLKKGFTAHLFLVVIVIAAVWGLVAYVLISKGIIKSPLNLEQKPQVELKTEYENPFDKKTQYVNPFDDSKNPVSSLK